MDRRGFLRALGVGGVAIAAAPALVLPSVTTSIARPERRIFTPPPGGWWRDGETAISFIERFDNAISAAAMAHPWQVEMGGVPFRERLDVEWTAAARYVFRPGDVVDLETSYGRALVCVTDVRFDGRRESVSAVGWEPMSLVMLGDAGLVGDPAPAIKTATPGDSWSARRSIERWWPHRELV